MGDVEGAKARISRAEGGSSLSRLGSILKREYRLAQLSGDTGRYARLAVEAAKANGSPAIRSLAAQALLADGRGDEARRIAGDGSGIPAKLRAALGLDEASAADSAAALAKGPDFWAGLANETSEDAYCFNAALSALASGDKSRAALELRTALDSGFRPPPEIAFDCGLYEDCLTLIEQRGAAHGRESRYASLAASARSLSGDSQGARAAWEGFIREYPAASSSTWRNLAAMEKNAGKRRAILERAAALFPGDSERILDLASFYAGEGMREEGLAVIGGLPESEPAVLVERLSLESIQAEAAQTEASLLMAVSGHPGDDGISRAAFFRLLGLKRREAAFRLLLDAEPRDGSPDIPSPWKSFAKACLLAAQGRDDEAVDAFDACASGAVHYASLWNAAVLLSRAGDQAGARKRLAAAIELADGPEEKARAYVFLGDCHLAQAQRDSARTAYLAALSQWPECPEAGLALAGLSEKSEKGG